MDLELGTWSILVQLLLIFVLVAVFAGRRHLKARRDARQPPAGAPPAAVAPPAMVRSPMPPRPVLTELPPELVPELVHPSFTDTCADWAPVRGTAPNARFSLSDWSAPTDRVALDTVPDPADLVWAERTSTPPATPARTAAASMSCTIAPQAQHCT
jgi:hypothetical protein